MKYLVVYMDGTFFETVEINYTIRERARNGEVDIIMHSDGRFYYLDTGPNEWRSVGDAL